MIRLTCFSLVFAIVGVSSSYGQSKPISRDEFWGGLRAALEKLREIPHKTTNTETLYRKGVVSSSKEEITESIPPDRTRTVETSTENGKTTKSEIMQIGSVYFCRSANGPWKKSDRYCGGSGMRSIPANAVSEFSMEEKDVAGRKERVHRHLATYGGQLATGSSSRYIYEDAYVLNEHGEILSRATRLRTADSDESDFITKEIYVYRPKGMTIVAPIN